MRDVQSQTVVLPGRPPAASAAPGSLLETGLCELRPRPTEAETPKRGPGGWCVHEASRCSDAPCHGSIMSRPSAKACRLPRRKGLVGPHEQLSYGSTPRARALRVTLLIAGKRSPSRTQAFPMCTERHPCRWQVDTRDPLPSPSSFIQPGVCQLFIELLLQSGAVLGGSGLPTRDQALNRCASRRCSQTTGRPE